MGPVRCVFTQIRTTRREIVYGRSKFALVIIALACVFAASVAVSAAGLPPWPYGFTTPSGPAPVAVPPASSSIPSLKRLPGTDREFTLQQIGDQYGPADWFPGDHPAMPEIVAHGRRDAMIAACGLCHYPNGKGRTENAGIAGLPVSYVIHTMHDFRDGNRSSADPRKANTNRMISFAKNMTDDEIKAAAEYFGSLKFTQWMTKVVETAMVPKTRPTFGMFITLPGNEKEPIGRRVVESPIDGESTEQLRNDHSGFVVYAPPRSLKKRRGARQNRRRQDDCVRSVPRGGSAWARSRTAAGRALAQLHRASVVRYAERFQEGRMDQPHEARS